MSRFDSGVALVFLPLLHFRGRWARLLGTCLLGIVAIVGASELLIRLFGSGYPMWITRGSAALCLLITLGRLAILQQSTSIRLLDGVVTITQNQHRHDYQFPAAEVEFVQTYRNASRTELQFLIKGKPKVRLLDDRPRDELEWAARFLRVAIRGRAPEEAAVMKMQTAEGQCQVCGEKMESRVVFCAKCRTPHHEECWSYVGTCSTFACREIRFTRA